MSEQHRHHSSVFRFIMSWEYVKCSPVSKNMINNSLIFSVNGCKVFPRDSCFSDSLLELSCRSMLL